MENEKHEPIQQRVHVDAPVEDAFHWFTESFGEWWPGDESERRAVKDGAVTVWDPPTRIEFTWSRDGDQTVNVEFEMEADGTRVTLTHHGWQTSGVAHCASSFVRFVCEQMMVGV